MWIVCLGCPFLALRVIMWLLATFHEGPKVELFKEKKVMTFKVHGPKCLKATLCIMNWQYSSWLANKSLSSREYWNKKMAGWRKYAHRDQSILRDWRNACLIRCPMQCADTVRFVSSTTQKSCAVMMFESINGRRRQLGKWRTWQCGFTSRNP